MLKALSESQTIWTCLITVFFLIIFICFLHTLRKHRYLNYYKRNTLNTKERKVINKLVVRLLERILSRSWNLFILDFFEKKGKIRRVHSNKSFLGIFFCFSSNIFPVPLII